MKKRTIISKPMKKKKPVMKPVKKPAKKPSFIVAYASGRGQ